MIPARILVIRGGAIGDFILTLPVFAALREHFPSALLSILGYPQIANLAVAAGLADEVRSIESPTLASFFAPDGELSEEWRSFFSEFEIVLSYAFDPLRVFENNIRRCCKGTFIAGPHRPDEAADQHATTVLLKPLEQLGIYNADPIPQLSLNSQPSTLNQLALHPGSGSEKKNWPEAKWAALIQWLVEETDICFVLIGGEAEYGKFERLARLIPSRRLNAAQNLPLVELAERLQHCAFFVGHDSGITHLAAALGLPGVALWGGSNEQVWRPMSGSFKLLRNQEGLPSVPVDEVFAAINLGLRDAGRRIN